MKKHAASDKICENTNAAKTPDTNTENSVKKHSTVKLVTSILSIAAVITVSAFAAPALGKKFFSDKPAETSSSSDYSKISTSASIADTDSKTITKKQSSSNKTVMTESAANTISKQNISVPHKTESIVSGKSGNNQNSSAKTAGNINGNIPEISSNSTTVQSNYGKKDFSIKSIDMLNYYSAKAMLDKKVTMTLSSKSTGNKTVNLLNTGNTKLLNLSGSIYNYAIDRYAPYKITKVTYFQAQLMNSNGFLAKKLGGIGKIDVVVTENSLDDMITFKKGGKYYSCLINSMSYDPETKIKTTSFSTHKYIEGFEIVKNFSQENYIIKVFYDGNGNVVTFNCERFEQMSNCIYEPDAIFLPPNGYSYTSDEEQTFTIDQLERTYKN